MDHTSCRLRLAAIADAPAILEIYAQYMDTPITFETELPSLEEFEGRIRAITAEYPWIVCEDETGRSSLSARRTVGMRNFLNIWTVG